MRLLLVTPEGDVHATSGRRPRLVVSTETGTPTSGERCALASMASETLGGRTFEVFETKAVVFTCACDCAMEIMLNRMWTKFENPWVINAGECWTVPDEDLG